MSIIKCEECGLHYECINFQPCPICKKIKEAQLELFHDGEQTFEMKAII